MKEWDTMFDFQIFSLLSRAGAPTNVLCYMKVPAVYGDTHGVAKRMLLRFRFRFPSNRINMQCPSPLRSLTVLVRARLPKEVHALAYSWFDTLFKLLGKVK